MLSEGRQKYVKGDKVEILFGLRIGQIGTIWEVNPQGSISGREDHTLCVGFDGGRIGHYATHEVKPAKLRVDDMIKTVKYVEPGTHSIEITNCIVKQSAHDPDRFYQITHVHKVGRKTLHLVVDRVRPDHMPSFRAGQRWTLVVRELETKVCRVKFKHYTWQVYMSPKAGK